MTLEGQRSTRSAYPAEIAIVLLLSLGQSAIWSIVSLTAKLTDGKPLASHTATLNAPMSPRPYLDLTYQVLNIFFDLVPVALAWYLLRRDGIRPGRDLGIDFRRPGFDAGWGAGLAAGIGLPGLLLVYAAIKLGVSAQIVPSALQPYWWAVPVLVLSAVQNAVLEEVLVVGYLTTRLRQLEVSTGWIVAGSAVLRGSYHLYQGFGGFVGNIVMGVIFAFFYLRTKRVMPLIVAHSILDITAFVGYDLLPDSWLTWLHP
ncbi:CAAX amino protease [Actinoplanes sp. SE50]|uniref:CPBP family intramembrane glutamic endopeptidase n=1 Tax=unclassified Actinoplanes TaxID=2626549 RepID=UPI00023EDD12|nr:MULTISPECIES: CPBP family intramembrane glutamic endopeptidase [unclassified Actinoplanes]AEV89125.1 abortive infection protein [Actinoplanes sp. SE50/110]ATO87531.1 CAAX amino protease [Actinoplanes sp. SE50]SLM04949.1 CAAX amino protease [Actinoplanes sp. SE50/110]